MIIAGWASPGSVSTKRAFSTSRSIHSSDCDCTPNTVTSPRVRSPVYCSERSPTVFSNQVSIRRIRSRQPQLCFGVRSHPGGMPACREGIQQQLPPQTPTQSQTSPPKATSPSPPAAPAEQSQPLLPPDEYNATVTPPPTNTGIETLTTFIQARMNNTDDSQLPARTAIHRGSGSDSSQHVAILAPQAPTTGSSPRPDQFPAWLDKSSPAERQAAPNCEENDRHHCHASQSRAIPHTPKDQTQTSYASKATKTRCKETAEARPPPAEIRRQTGHRPANPTGAIKNKVPISTKQAANQANDFFQAKPCKPCITLANPDRLPDVYFATAAKPLPLPAPAAPATGLARLVTDSARNTPDHSGCLFSDKNTKQQQGSRRDHQAVHLAEAATSAGSTARNNANSSPAFLPSCSRRRKGIPTNRLPNNAGSSRAKNADDWNR